MPPGCRHHAFSPGSMHHVGRSAQRGMQGRSKTIHSWAIKTSLLREANLYLSLLRCPDEFFANFQKRKTYFLCSIKSTFVFGAMSCIAFMHLMKGNTSQVSFVSKSTSVPGALSFIAFMRVLTGNTSHFLCSMISDSASGALFWIRKCHEEYIIHFVQHRICFCLWCGVLPYAYESITNSTSCILRSIKSAFVSSAMFFPISKKCIMKSISYISRSSKSALVSGAISLEVLGC